MENGTTTMKGRLHLPNGTVFSDLKDGIIDKVVLRLNNRSTECLELSSIP
ncbi:MAG: hypothetical protein AB2L18_06505 [Anaerolineaceae bacterium]